jgi:TRAP-type C4-dicarboxylate transport system substrate-binding protein
MTNRKFYKTIIPLEILSEEPVGTREINHIIEEATNGSYSMRVLPSQELGLNGVEAAAALKEQGSDPSFFNLTDSGEDNEQDLS